jgi:pimeloyl-ACP methyl ester carboxylesterase
VFAHETGSGTPVVLLHGFGLDHRSLLPLDPTFERSGRWRRIYLDLPGATGSPAKAVAGSQEVADAVVEEIRARAGAEPFAVLGNSFGGMIARYVAHELRSQVLGLATLAGVFVAPRDERTVPPRTVLRREPGIVPLLGAALAHYREDAVVESTADARAFLQYVLPVGYSDAWSRVGHYPRASFAALDAAGHHLLFEQPELCSALVADWLERIRQGK